VQPGYHTPDEDVPQLRFFERGTWHLAAHDLIEDLRGPTMRAARQGANLVVWPEAAIWVDPYRLDSVARDIAALAQAAQATLVVPWFDPDEDQGAAIAVDPERGLLRAQPKQRPMWFLGERGDNRSPPAPVEAGGHVVGTLLGVDSQQPGLARRFAAGSSGAAPADVLAASTHDWEQLAGQQQALLELSALASGVPVARADWRFRSSVIDGDGSVAASAGPELERAVVVGEEVGRRDTPYRSIGDVVGWASVGLVVLALAWAVSAPARRRLRGRRGGREALSGYGGVPESLTISNE
jgi:apolipoprotein N-acyltransferase